MSFIVKSLAENALKEIKDNIIRTEFTVTRLETDLAGTKDILARLITNEAEIVSFLEEEKV